MSLLNHYQILLHNLAGLIPEGSLTYHPREEARAELIRETGQDFGYEVERWREWLRNNRQALPGAKGLKDKDFNWY